MLQIFNFSVHFIAKIEIDMTSRTEHGENTVNNRADNLILRHAHHKYTLSGMLFVTNGIFIPERL